MSVALPGAVDLWGWDTIRFKLNLPLVNIALNQFNLTQFSIYPMIGGWGEAITGSLGTSNWLGWYLIKFPG